MRDRRRFVKLDLLAIQADNSPLRDVSDGALKVYIKMLAFICRNRDKQVFGKYFSKGLLVCGPSQKRLAATLGKNRCTIRALLKELTEKQWIAPIGNNEGTTIYLMGKTGEDDGGRWEEMLLEGGWLEWSQGVAPPEPGGWLGSSQGGGSGGARGVARFEPLNSNSVPFGNLVSCLPAAAAVETAAAVEPEHLPEGKKPSLDPQAVIRICREIVNLDKDDTGPIDPHDVAAYLLNNLPNEDLAEEAAKALYSWYKKVTNKGEKVASVMAMARTVAQQVLAKHKHDGDSPI